MRKGDCERSLGKVNQLGLWRDGPCGGVRLARLPGHPGQNANPGAHHAVPVFDPS